MAEGAQANVPAAVGRDLAAIHKRLPPAKATFQNRLFATLLDALLADREGLVPLEEAWRGAGYPEKYPQAVFDRTVVDRTTNNLRAQLRDMREKGQVSFSWAVEFAEGSGYRLRVLDEPAGAAFTGDWLLTPLDTEVWEASRIVQFLDLPGVPQPAEAPRVVPVWASLGLGLAIGYLLWSWLSPRTPAVPEPVPTPRASLGAVLAQVACSSSVWADGPRHPDDAWTQCGHAVDGLVLGSGAWVALGGGGEDWIEVVLREEAEVSSIRIHFSDWPCLEVAVGDLVCGEGTRPDTVTVEGSLDGAAWFALGDPVPAATGPWEPLTVEFAPRAVRRVRVTGSTGGFDPRYAFQVAELVIDPLPLEDYGAPVPVAEEAGL